MDCDVVNSRGARRELPALAHDLQRGFVEQRPDARLNRFGCDHVALRVDRETNADRALLRVTHGARRIRWSGLATFALAKNQSLRSARCDVARRRI